MAYVSQKEAFDYLNGTGPAPGGEGAGGVLLTSGVPGAPSGGGGGNSQALAVTGGSEPPVQPTSSPQIGGSLGVSTSGGIESRLFDPLEQAVGEGREALGGATRSFYDAAGALGERDWEKLGGQGIIDRGLESRQTGPGSAAYGLTHADYVGPEVLDMFYEGPDARDVRARGQALTSGSGLQSLIGASAPQLTPGAQRFEAQTLLDRPAYREEAERHYGAAEGFFKELAAEREKAEKHAGAREEEEEALRGAARGYVDTGIQSLFGTLDETAEARNAENTALSGLYQQFVNATDEELPGLMKRPEFAALDAGGWKKLQEAREKKAAIDAKYADLSGLVAGLGTEAPAPEGGLVNAPLGSSGVSLADLAATRPGAKRPEAAARPEPSGVPLDERAAPFLAGEVEPLINPQGIEQLGLRVGDEVYNLEWARRGQGEPPEGFTAKEWQALAEHLIRRQIERERSFGGGTVMTEPGKAHSYDVAEAVEGLGTAFGDPWERATPAGHHTTGPGELRAYDPLYFAGALQSDPALADPLDPRGYAEFRPGTEATRYNVATEDQLGQLRGMHELLDRANEIAEEDPWQAAEILTDAGRWIEDWQKWSEGREALLDKAGDDWRRQVTLAHDRWKESKKGFLGDLMRFIGGASMFVPGGQLLGAGLLAGSTAVD